MDRYQQKLSAYKDVSVDYFLLAATDLSGTAATLITGVTSFAIFVQKISIAITTSAAKSLTFEDTASTPLVAAVVPASQADGPVLFDFGPDGLELTESKSLQLANSGAGVAAAIQVQAYQKAIGVATIIVGNQVGGGTPGTGGSLEPGSDDPIA